MKTTTCQAPDNAGDSDESVPVRPCGNLQADKETQLYNVGEKQ